MTPPEDQEKWVWLARIRHSQGRKGEVFADILTDFPEKFAERKQLWLIADPDSAHSKTNSDPANGTGLKGTSLKGTGFSPYIETSPESRALAPEGNASESPRLVELQAHWLHKGGIVLHFVQSNSISDAETLKGLIVAIPLAERAPLADDEVYVGDLIGCTLFDVAGPAPLAVGIIEAVDRTAGPVALLVVVPEGAKNEILIPFAQSYLRRIDLAAKHVEMALPEGLIELNSPGET